MIRTSLVLPTPLHQRLVLTAQSEGVSLSHVIRGLLDQALAKRENARIERTYNVLKELDGMGGDTVRDASTTINEVLYGEKGAWRGSAK